MYRGSGAAAAFLLAAALPLGAQNQVTGPGQSSIQLPMIGTPAEDRNRVTQILGRAPLTGALIRSPSSRPIQLDSTASFRIAFVRPFVDGAWNSKIPFSIDDGSLWSGRGLSTRMTTGFVASLGGGRLRLQFAPELMHVQNLSFPILPSEIPGRSGYASRFHSGPLSIDLPVRSGADPFTLADFGQSAMWAPVGGVDVGVSTENQWWGPAIQNALIMSNNAAGIPEVFVRTNRPWQSRIGSFEAKVILGALTESLFFDDVSDNDRRALSGLVVTYTPRIEPNLAIGASRVVYSPASRAESFVKHAFDALLKSSTTRPDSTNVGSRTFDQLFSLFGRWVFPESGLELYGEWARMLPPNSLRDLLVAPQYTQGYTLGLQAAGAVRGNATLRFLAEVTDLEQTPTSRPGDTLSFYTSRVVPQGYTQRGQSVGAAIGPGSSSQLLRLDYLAPRWSVGGFAQRIRWDNDAYYLQPSGFSFFSHDVTVLAGVRASFRYRGRELALEYGASQRLNFLFQNIGGGFGPARANDFYNELLRFWIAL